MPQLEREIDANHAVFFDDWTAAATRNWETLKNNEAYQSSYRRLTALQAIKVYLLKSYSVGSAAFFFEAHNDALVSHVAASMGGWRTALQSLRGCIENTLCAIYYRDHPIELDLWGAGEFLIGFTELIRYMEKHPQLSKLNQKITGLETLKSEYATLSKAVHASATNFRMTDSASTVLLWNADPVKASMWSTRERKTVEAISLLMACLNSSLLQGSKLAPLRDVLRFSVSSSNRRKLKDALGINIPDF